MKLHSIKQKGFTLIELLVVIAILVVFPSDNSDLKSFHIKALNTDFKGAVKLYDWFINE